MSEQELHFLDNSTLAAVKRCALHAHYRYDMHWVPEHRPIYFDFGTAWHAMMDAVWKGVCWDHLDQKEAILCGAAAFDAEWEKLGYPLNPPSAVLEEWSPRTPGIAKEMLVHYVATRHEWLRYKIELVAVEQPFVVPLDPDDPTLFYVGRLDKVIREGGYYKAPDHKTTTDYRVADDHFSSNFISSFDPNGQTEGYNHGLKTIYGEASRGVFIDAAMVHKKVHDAFKFIPAYREPHRLEAWRQETLYWAHTWLQFKRTGFFPRNTEGCVNRYHKTCEYIETCRQYGRAVHDLEPPRGFVVKKWEPYDLSLLHKAAEEVLNG